MNPVFVILVFLIGILIWFGINFLFPIIGKILCDLFEETKFNITNKDNDEEEL